jgi:CBS domain-containing protein
MKSVKIREYMLSKRRSVSAQTSLADAVDILGELKITGVPVVDENNMVVGFLSEQDCIKQILESSYHSDEVVTVSKVMVQEVLSVSPSDSVVDVASRMLTDKPKVYPVCEEGHLVGVITRAEVLRAVQYLKTL